MNLRSIVLFVCLIFHSSAHGIVCSICKKQIEPLCHTCDGTTKCGCKKKDGTPTGRCPCPIDSCNDCRLKEAQARARAAMEAKRTALTKQIAEVRAQLNALTATGGKGSLEAKVTRAKAILAQINAAQDLDPSAKAGLLSEARAKIVELQGKINGLDAQQAALLAKLRALEAELNSTLNK